jgi:hypothetical protein
VKSSDAKYFLLNLFLILVLLTGTIGPIGAATGPVDFIPSPNRVDMVSDNAQNILYISSTDGNLLRYNLTSKSFLNPINLGGYLYGMDISPDGNNIVITDDSADYANRISWVNVVNLPSGNNYKIQFPLLESLESGTASVAFATNDTVLVSSNGATWNPLRKINITTGITTRIGTVSASGYVTVLSASADHSVIGIAEQCISPHGPERYRVSDGNISSGPALSTGVADIAASRNGQQYAVTNRVNTYIYDQNLNYIKQFHGTYSDEKPLGVVYSPSADYGFISWVNSSGTHSEIQMFDTNSLNLVAIIDTDPPFALPAYDNSYRSGRLRISSDGSLLFASVNGGVNVYAVPEPTLTMIVLPGLISMLVYMWFRRRIKNKRGRISFSIPFSLVTVDNLQNSTRPARAHFLVRLAK